MLPSLITLFFFQVQLSHALGLQIGNLLPRFIKGLPYSFSRHAAYVDQKVNPTPRSYQNHEQWGQRHVVTFTNASSVGYMTVSAPTGSLVTMSLGSSSANYTSPATLFSAISSAWVSKNASSTRISALSLSSVSTITPQAIDLASLYGSLKDLDADKSEDWDEKTESACSSALIDLHGVATNPSGLAACYNIQSLDVVTGSFEVDLRLYRISAPTGGWLKLDSSSLGVGLTYVSATISTIGPKKAKREDQPLQWFPAQRDEAADIYIRRSTGAPPRRLESMAFVGTVEVGSLAELRDRTTASSLLTPSITLSGTQQDGTLINTRLSNQDASFLCGVFASPGSESSQPSSTAGIDEFIFPGTKLDGFPTGLIISSIWAVLYLMTMGYGAFGRYQAREAYRRRVKHRFSGDAITKRRMRWA